MRLLQAEIWVPAKLKKITDLQKLTLAKLCHTVVVVESLEIIDHMTNYYHSWPLLNDWLCI